ncbi:hypothetical protein JCM5350_007302 [Sporobolomyces pararoseus]
MAPPPPPPPPKATATPPPPPPPIRSASPAMSIQNSRPSSPTNFLSQSTNRTRTTASTTLNLSLLLADLETLNSNEGLSLFKGKQFESLSTSTTTTQPESTRTSKKKKTLEDFQKSSKDGLDNREDAAELAQEWLEKMEIVLEKSKGILNDDRDTRGRIDRVENWVSDVEKGLGET